MALGRLVVTVAPGAEYLNRLGRLLARVLLRHCQAVAHPFLFTGVTLPTSLGQGPEVIGIVPHRTLVAEFADRVLVAHCLPTNYV